MKVLDRFPWIGQRFRDVREDQGGIYCTASCPLKCHKTSRCRFWVGTEGVLLFTCWAGCNKLEILRAVGAGWKDCWPNQEMPDKPKQEVAAKYDYRDEAGRLLYQTVRLEPGWNGRDKDFRQRVPIGHNGEGKRWNWKLGDTRRVLYRLPDLLAADPIQRVYIVAGEKDVESLRSIGELATTNVCGERSEWLEEYSATLADRHVAVIEDRDSAGKRHADEVCGSLLNHAASLVRVRLAAKDVTAWLSHERTGYGGMEGAFHEPPDSDELRVALNREVSKCRLWIADQWGGVDEEAAVSSLPEVIS